MKTRITELFGIKYPILLAGMSWITQPEIVAAVSNAGGLGILGITPYEAEKARELIKKIRQLTDKPFAINQALISPTAKKNIGVVVEEKVPVVNYTLGRPSEITPLVKSVHGYGGKVIGTVALAKHAVRAEQLGVDAVNVTGHEAAAHAGYVTSLVLVPIVARSVKLPITAAGGFYDGRGLAAALALGADGITMGTRFAVTRESPLNQRWQQAIIKGSEQDTLYIETGDPANNSRVLKTRMAESQRSKRSQLFAGIAGVIEAKRLLKVSWWELMRSGLSTRTGEDSISIPRQIHYAALSARSNKVIFNGDEKAGNISVGQVMGGINDVPTCKELIERIVAEAKTALDKGREKAFA